MNRLLPLAALVAATIALPAAAQGATLERYSGVPGTMQLTGAPAETNLITVEDRPLSVVITDNAGPLKLKRATGCVRLDSNSARCFLTKQVWLDLGDGNDVATIASRRAVSVSRRRRRRPLHRERHRRAVARRVRRRLRHRRRQLLLRHRGRARRRRRDAVRRPSRRQRPHRPDRRDGLRLAVRRRAHGRRAANSSSSASTATTRSPAARAPTCSTAAPATTASTPATASSTPSTAASVCSTC